MGEVRQQLKEYLDKHNVRYITIQHSPAYTAQGVAHSAHISGRNLAKTVMIFVDGELAMAVLPAMYKVNTEALKLAIGADVVEIAKESDFESTFPKCELGAMPPFGNLWNLDVYVAEKLAEDELIAFNAGTHTELIQMSYVDFEWLVAPQVVRLTYELI